MAFETVQIACVKDTWQQVLTQGSQLILKNIGQPFEVYLVGPLDPTPTLATGLLIRKGESFEWSANTRVSETNGKAYIKLKKSDALITLIRNDEGAG